MRTVFFAFLLLFFPTGHASAVFYNNSETIEIGDGELPEPPVESGGNEGGGGGSTGGESGSTGSTSGSSGGGGSSGGSGAGEGGTTGGTGGTGETGGGGGDEEELQELITLLTEAGALLGGMSNGGGSGSSGLGSVGGSSGGAGESIRVIGAKVRDAFQNNFDLKELLQYWKRGSGEPSANEYGLIAASTAIRDSNVQEVSFTAEKFEIVYRSRGYLLIVIPWSFSVRVGVVPDASVRDERIQVKLPWYSFFVRKFFTTNGLKQDIDEVIEKTKSDNPRAVDGTALVFEAVALFLKNKVGTVSDSVILGTNPK
ncbi:MAG: hypothetical protein WAZ27_04660 [Minisyncoccia bacterium]